MPSFEVLLPDGKRVDITKSIKKDTSEKGITKTLKDALKKGVKND
jgi:hypothetical protein|tara:strand:+ start:319 stop:453 length:135 start_codon:yes stop_codon:yes gene_type:complete